MRSARNQIECTFWEIKSKVEHFKQSRRCGFKFCNDPRLRLFCFYNICEINNCDLNDEVINKQIGDERQTQCCGHHEKLDKLYSYSSARGRKVREALSEYLYENE